MNDARVKARSGDEPQPEQTPARPSSESRLRVVVVDGRAVMAAALAAFLEREPEIEVVRTCTDESEALKAAQVLDPHIVLVELNAPPNRGFGLVRQIRGKGLACRIVLIADELSEDDTMEALTLGVPGVVLSTMPPNLLVRCVRKVAHGGQWIEKVAMGRALERMLRREEAERKVRETLTPRELEVVRLVTDGLRNKEIASRLNIGEGTVKVYLNAIYKKLDVSGRVELTSHAHSNNLV